MATDVKSINLGRGEALLDDDQIIPICDMLDEEGEATLFPGAAKAFVAGPCKDGKWYADGTDTYNRVRIN